MSSRPTRSPSPTRTDDRCQSDEFAAQKETECDPSELEVLVLSGLSQKNERHYGPLADVAGDVTLVCLDPERAIDDANYVVTPDIGPRALRVLLLFFIALRECHRNDYDAIASISLVPYGFYALVLKSTFGCPAHLGIIGIDLDHHVEQWYGEVPKAAFRRFDVISVPGPSHADKLRTLGIPSAKIEILTNAIDTDVYCPPRDEVVREYDFVWVGRFSEEKAPLRFVRALEALDAGGHEFRAVMVGDGPLQSEVVDALDEADLGCRVDLPGRVDAPVEYYYRSRAFVLTSRRDALPLVMIEAMATGLPCVVPPVGSIPDTVTNGEDAVVVRDTDPECFAAAMARLRGDPDYRRSIGERAASIRDNFSFEQAADDWCRILSTLRS